MANPGNSPNVDPRVVQSFGKEWQTFDQSPASETELKQLFESYFSIFPWEPLPKDAEGFDLGCGTGRWARFVAPRVGKLHCIDPSDALEVARRNLRDAPNVVFHHAAVDDFPLAAGSMDFGYSLGVLHHVPDTTAGVISCAERLKPGAPFLLYLYYNFENRPAWFRGLWRTSDAIRRLTSRLPFAAKLTFSEIAAALLYWPAANVARGLEKAGMNVSSLPLATYRTRSYYQMRTDALDRFGTSLEKRFSRADIVAMFEAAGLERIRFSEQPPFWCAVGYRRGHP